MSNENIEKKSFFQRHRNWVVAGVVILVVALFMMRPKETLVERKREMQMVAIVSPPPPPPPEPPKVKEEKMIEQVPVKSASNMDTPDQDDQHAEDGPPDAFNQHGSKNGRGLGGGAGRWGLYAAQVQGAIQEALLRNPKTSSSILRIKVRIWPEASGRISRVELIDSTGNPSLDSAIKDDVLLGLDIQPPPPDMPKPIVMRITARRS